MKKVESISYFTYIIRCSDTTLYTGITLNIEKRVIEHDTLSKGSRYTRSRRPVSVVYTEQCDDKSSTLKREMNIKKMSRFQKEGLILNNIPHI